MNDPIKEIKSSEDFEVTTTTFDESEDLFTKELETEEDLDIQVVNELATVDDDPTLPCFTLRVFIVGIVSIYHGLIFTSNLYIVSCCS